MSSSDTGKIPQYHLSTAWSIMAMSDKLNAYRITLSTGEAVMFLVHSAREFKQHTCDEDGCPVCESFTDLWQEVYRSLRAGDREDVEVTLSALGVGKPAYPGVPF